MSSTIRYFFNNAKYSVRLRIKNNRVIFRFPIKPWVRLFMIFWIELKFFIKNGKSIDSLQKSIEIRNRRIQKISRFKHKLSSS